MTKEINNNINYKLAKGILDMLLENRIITLTEYEEIDKKNKLSFA
jgi:predicted transcriptional regulator